METPAEVIREHLGVEEGMTKLEELKKAVDDALIAVDAAVKDADAAYAVLWAVNDAYEAALKEEK